MKYIKEGTEFLDQLKDSVHDLYDENKELKGKIEKQKDLIHDIRIHLIEEHKEKERLEKELDKFRPFTSAYEMKKEIERLNKEIKRLKQKLLIGKKANILFFDEVGVDKE